MNFLAPMGTSEYLVFRYLQIFYEVQKKSCLYQFCLPGYACILALFHFGLTDIGTSSEICTHRWRPCGYHWIGQLARTVVYRYPVTMQSWVIGCNELRLSGQLFFVFLYIFATKPVFGVSDKARLSYIDKLEDWNFSRSKSRYNTFQKTNNKGADQPARMRRLVCAFDVAKPKTVFLPSSLCN